MLKICKQCGSEFDASRKERRYCSRDCYYKSIEGKECSFKGKKINKHKKHTLSEAGRKRLIESNKRRDWSSPEAKKKLKNRKSPAWIFLRGEKNPNWKKDKSGTERIEMLRKTVRYKEWVQAVFKRDKYTCQQCGYNKGGILEAHHIKSFTFYPKLRFEISNGLTLCKHCHKKTDNWGNKAKQTI